MNKQGLIDQITSFDPKYGLHWGLYKDMKWDTERLQYMEIEQLKWYLRDIKTFERNKKMLNGE